MTLSPTHSPNKRYSVRHLTRYRYSQNVSLSQHFLHLLPRGTASQRVERADLKIEPVPATRRDAVDYFGNPTCLVSLDEEHLETVLLAESQISLQHSKPPAAKDTPPWEEIAKTVRESRSKDLLFVYQYCFASPKTKAGPDALALGQTFFAPGTPILEGAMALMDHIFTQYTYDPEATDVSTPVDDVMRIKGGVCQDFAHLQLACLRALGLPARYVSGYLLTHPPEGQERLQGADASHAWLSIWTGEDGWVDLDPTNNLIPGDEHITLAWGRDYGDVSPINGITFGGGAHQIDVEVDVLPMDDAL